MRWRIALFVSGKGCSKIREWKRWFSRDTRLSRPCFKQGRERDRTDFCCCVSFAGRLYGIPPVSGGGSCLFLFLPDLVWRGNWKAGVRELFSSPTYHSSRMYRKYWELSLRRDMPVAFDGRGLSPFAADDPAATGASYDADVAFGITV